MVTESPPRCGGRFGWGHAQEAKGVNYEEMNHTVLVIGAGQAGLSVSWHLKHAGVPHTVYDRVGAVAAWRDQRWDSFCLVTPNWTVELPGKSYVDVGDDPDGFMDKRELLQFFDEWVASFEPPLQAPVEVLSVRPRAAGGGFEVETSRGRETAAAVVVCTATYQRQRQPAVAVTLPAALPQLHAADYKNPEQLPPGRVLVCGAGQSGCQVCEDLLRAGRAVSLAVGLCRTLPRRYRGRDVIDWQHRSGATRVVNRPCESVSPIKSVLYGAFVWAHRALNRQKRRFPARAASGCSTAALKSSRIPRCASRRGTRR